MTLPRPPKAVVFDMDGLLFDTEVLYRQAITDAAAELSLDYPNDLYLSTIGLTGEDCAVLLRAHFGQDFDVEGLWARSYEGFIALASTQLRMKDGVLELLDALDQAGIRRAIATSSRHASVEHHLNYHGLVDRFDHIVAKGDYARSKPAPDPFLAAAAKLSVDPVDCLALEDSHNGIRAASSAGMMTIMVPDLLEPTDEIRALCVRIVRSLHEVRDYFEDRAETA